MTSMRDRVLRRLAEDGPYHSYMALLRDVAQPDENVSFADLTGALNSLNKQGLVGMRKRGDSVRSAWATSKALKLLGLNTANPHTDSFHPGDPTDYRNQPNQAIPVSPVVVTYTTPEPREGKPVEHTNDVSKPKNPNYQSYPERLEIMSRNDDKLKTYLGRLWFRYGHDAATVGDLSAQWGTTPAMGSMWVTAMARRGLVTKTMARGRAHVYVTITDKGCEFIGVGVDHKPVTVTVPETTGMTLPENKWKPALENGWLEMYPTIKALWDAHTHEGEVLDAAAALERAGLASLAAQALEAVAGEKSDLERELLQLLDRLGV